MEDSPRYLRRGYAALIPTLVVCAVLTVLAFQSAMSTYLARLSALEAERKAVSQARAHSCAQVALFELSADPSYAPQEGGDVVWLSEEERCVIESVLSEGNELFVIVSGAHEGFRSRMELRLQENTISRPAFLVLSFREI